MYILDRIIKIIDTINEKISKAVSFLVYALILTLAYEVFARYFLGAPTQWSFNLTYFLSSFFLMLSMGYTWKCNEHVAVDIFSSRLSPKIGSVLNIVFILFFFFLAWINIGRVMYVDVLRSWALQETSTIGSMPPVYPYKTWMFFGVLLLLLQGISQLLKGFVSLFGRGMES